MKSILMAFMLASAGAAGVAGLFRGPDVLSAHLSAETNAEGTLPLARTNRIQGAAPVLEPQSRLIQVADAGTPSSSNAQQKPVVDESALRYFASHGDTARLNAEIARLRALYPTWTPPENPLAIPENDDKQLEQMWALYSQSRYADVRAAIAKRKTEEPQWTPPADLLDRLAVGEKRAELIAASNAGHDEDVVKIGASTPSLLTCSDADVLWRVADALAKTDRTQRAKDAYIYMLENCSETSVRLATVQKASTRLSYGDMQDILARERSDADGKKEFDAIRNDLARRFVAEGDGDAALTVAAPYLRTVEKLVADEGLASDALLLGWYHLRRDENALAEPFFRKARAIEDSASASQGLALILLARRMPAEGEAVMYPWRTSSTEAMATYLATSTNLLALDPVPALEPQVLNRIAEVTLEQKHPETGEQFGWYALAMDQPATAEEWFTQVLGWKSDYEPAAYGLAISRLRMKDLAGVAAVQKVWAERSLRIARLGEKDNPEGKPRTVETRRPLYVEEAPQERVRERAATLPVRREEPVVVRTRSERTARSTADCRTTQNATGMAPGQALSLGWCLMNLNRPLEAAQAFETALAGNGRTRSDAAYGQSLAYLRAGLTNDAAVAATRASLDTGRTAELQASILADRAVSSFRANRFRETIVYLDQRKRFRSEPTDLMVLRAYSMKNLGYRGDALRLFEALAETGHRDAMRALGDMRAQR